MSDDDLDRWAKLIVEGAECEDLEERSAEARATISSLSSSEADIAKLAHRAMVSICRPLIALQERVTRMLDHKRQKKC